ncbi:hypothetical protein BT63DRAFT_217171 [Microthyrium microscopicum]|uniref:Heterokaryon incompatibility domain-containing protein n=1 Tax=Microthyrium microscopicum TaxID=703497 RepID=A0A6A6UGP9_9PEZI|nr:hypothetical protein BT63DRAFT_217171 [Microthyrium microscopicum]
MPSSVDKLLSKLKIHRKAPPEDLPEYPYQPLDTSRDEIRLITLHPGKYGNPILISIHHAPLVPIPEPPGRMTIEELRETMPYGWEAHETFDGRYFFTNKDIKSSYNDGSAIRHAHWNHPDPGFDRSKYRNLGPDRSLTKVQFEALSYVWGPKDDGYYVTVIPKATITDSAARSCVKEKGKQYNIKTRSNLYKALQCMRETRRSRIFWIDAICINQADIPERSLQVRRMGDIYAFAHRVVLWTGFSDNMNSDKSTIKSLEGVSHGIVAARDGFVCIDDVNIAFSTLHRSLKNKLGTSEIRQLVEFFNSMYFWRLWIWQEMRLSTRRSIIHYGFSQIPFHTFAVAVSRIATNGKRINPALINDAGQIFQLLRSSNIDLELLQTASQRDCENPRDKIYAILGLLSPSFAQKIRPDYELPIDAVYRDCFLAHLNLTARLELPFTYCRQKGRTLTGPGWIPDFSNPPAWISAQYFSAAGSSSSETWISGELGDVLNVVGVSCTTVASIAHHADDVGGAKTTFSTLRRWYNFALGSSSSLGPIDNKDMESFCDLLLDGRVRDRVVNAFSTMTLDETRARIQPLLNLPLADTANDDQEHYSSIAAEYEYLIQGRSFLRLTDDKIGLGPEDSEPEDLVCVFLGACRPVVLRPAANGKFRIVGECDILGLRDGEALLGPLPSPWRSILGILADGFLRLGFRRHGTEEFELEDPRVDPISEPWERMDYHRERHDPKFFEKFRNKDTGEVINSDPRMLPDALRARGVNLRTFSLI